jgi:hypothetical protein
LREVEREAIELRKVGAADRHAQVRDDVLDLQIAGEADVRRVGVELRAAERDDAVVQRKVRGAGDADRVAGIRECHRVLRQPRGAFAGAFEDLLFVPAVLEIARRRGAQARPFDAPVAEELFDGDAVVAQIDAHRIRLGVLCEDVVRADRAAAVFGALHVHGEVVGGDAQRAARVRELVRVGDELRRRPAPRERKVAGLSFEARVERDRPFEHGLDREDLFHAREVEARPQSEVVHGFGERIELAGEEGLDAAAFECDRLQREHARRVAEAAAHRDVERLVVLDAHAHVRAGHEARVQPLGASDGDV